jgi:hypothetical protein
VLEAKNDLAAGEFLSFDYRGDFFHRHVPGSVTPPGCKARSMYVWYECSLSQ